MLHDIIEARPVGDHRLAVTFDDGVHGEVDVAAMVPFEGVFAPLRSQTEFERVFVNRELGSVSWPCGADLDTQVSLRSSAGSAARGSGAGRFMTSCQVCRIVGEKQHRWFASQKGIESIDQEALLVGSVDHGFNVVAVRI